MRRFEAACLFVGGLAGLAVPTFCFLMAAWNARTLDYGERWGVTGFISIVALFAVALLATFTLGEA